MAGQNRGYGLFSLRERLTYLGGKIEISSISGRGTRVVLTAPLTVEKEKGGVA